MSRLRDSIAAAKGGLQQGAEVAQFKAPTLPRKRRDAGISAPAPEDGGGDLGFEVNFGDLSKSGGDLLSGVADVLGRIPLAPGMVGGQELLTDAVGAAGKIPTGTGQTLGQAIGGPLSLVGSIGEGLDFLRRELIEKPIARGRIEGRGLGAQEFALRGAPGIGSFVRAGDALDALKQGKSVNEVIGDRSQIPADIQARAEAGESTDALARELTERVEGLSSDFSTQLYGSMVYDPMNLILPGAGKAISGVKSMRYAYEAAVATDELASLGVTQRLVGEMASRGANGMSRHQAAVASKVFGPMTRGVIKAFGTNEHRALLKGAEQLGATAQTKMENALATAHAHVERTALWERSAARASEDGPVQLANLTKDRAGLEASAIERADRLNSPRQLEKENRVFATGTLDNFAGLDDAELFERSYARLAAVTELTVDEVKAVYPQMTRKLAQLVQHASFGEAGNVLSNAKRLALTPVTPARAVPRGAKKLVRELPRQIQKAYDEGNAVEGVRLQKMLEDLKGGWQQKPAGVGKAPSPASIERMTLMRTDGLTVARLKAAIKSLTPAEGEKVAAGAQQIAEELVRRYQPLRQQFADSAGYSADDVLKHLKGLKTGTGKYLPSSLQKRALAVPAIREAQERMAKLGYEIVLEPKSGKRQFFNQFKKDATNKLDEMPWVPIVGDATPHFEVRNRLGEFVDDSLRGIDQRLYLQGAVRRAVEGGKGAWSENEATAYVRAIQHLGVELGTTPRGLAYTDKLMDDAAVRVLGQARYNAMMQMPGKDPVWLIMRAFEGDLNIVGATQKGTGRIKTRLAKTNRARVLAEGTVVPSRSVGTFVPAFVENIFPQITWKLMPHHQWMERVESMVWNLVRGVRQTSMSAETSQMWANLIRSNDNVRLTLEASIAVGLQGGVAATKLIQAPGRVNGMIRQLMAGGEVIAGKEVRAISEAAGRHPEEFQKWARGLGGEYEKLLQQWYKTDDWGVIAKNFWDERLDYMTNPGQTLNNLFDTTWRTGDFQKTADLETLWQAYRGSAEATMKESLTLHFFKADRSWAERTINHIFFGIYPFSYMMGKVLPEYLRFLLRRPFGLNAPLLGLQGQQKLHDAVQVNMANDPEWQEYSETHPGTLRVIDNMLPSNPFNVSVGAGPGLRLFATGLQDPQKAAQGIPQELKRIVSRGAGRTTSFGTGLGVESVRDAEATWQDVTRGIEGWLGIAERQGPVQP